MEKTLTHRPIVLAGIVLGIGQAGFFDGIVLHQLLQWHHMFSSVATDTTVSGLELNTLGDGLFHLADWLITLTGIFLLWRAGRQGNVIFSTQTFLGAFVLGFGLFNVVEGILDHQVLGIHHVKSGPHELAWDIGFLIVNAVILAIGWLTLQSGKQNAETAD
ncbi:DUF2243 domain-containing protein [Oculatella sp. FACHB-28]|uniref:DUF2243 domain-containing protein n=1 Tax=Oculatella sp. FACHB-28 TaxID=2692845 RepID=UPI001684EC3B|nr:DUF2243 domain-containing protein [Oculatella sp. FACHB-28]